MKGAFSALFKSLFITSLCLLSLSIKEALAIAGWVWDECARNNSSAVAKVSPNGPSRKQNFDFRPGPFYFADRVGVIWICLH